MILSEGEVALLLKLGQIPFLPVARRADDMTPVYLEDTEYTTEEYGLFLQCLEKRGLILLDYGVPLAHFDYKQYKGFPVHGSFALTERGQQVLEIIEIQGI